MEQPTVQVPKPGAPAGAQHSLAVYRRIAILFLLLTAGVAALVFYVVFTKAHVVVMSEQENVESEFIIDIARDPASGEVPGDVLEVSDSLIQVFPATSMEEAEVPAEGEVRITSTLSRTQTLVATTRLLTPDEVLFRIDRTVTVPAFGSVEVGVHADEPGEAGDIGHAAFTIPGLNPNTRKHFEVETIEPLAGGVRKVRSVTSGDIANAVEVLEERLVLDLTARLGKQAEEKGLSLGGQSVLTETTEQDTDVPAGSEADEFELTVTVRATGVFYDEECLAGQVRSRLRDLIAYDQALSGVEEDTAAREIEKRDLVTGRVNMRVSATGTAIISADAPPLDPEKLTGVSVEAAIQYLEKLEGVSSASIDMSPFWSNRMPDIADHITIEVR